jgi:hypothetical protein
MFALAVAGICVFRTVSSLRTAQPTCIQKVKKQSQNTSVEAQGENMYSSYSFTTSDLDGGEKSASCFRCSLAPGKGPPVPIVQEAGWAPEPVWTQRLEEKSFASAGDRTLIARWSSPWADTILTELPRLLYPKGTAVYLCGSISAGT